MDNNSLSHTKWNCKYHIVFTPKFKGKIIYGQLKQDIANILSTLCKRKGVHIVEAEMCSDHVHMLVEIPPSISVFGWNMKYKKSGKSLCTLYPMRGYYIALVVIGRKEMIEAELLMPLCSDYVQTVFHDTKTGNGQKWLMIDVREREVLEDVLNLIQLRK